MTSRFHLAISRGESGISLWDSRLKRAGMTDGFEGLRNISYQHDLRFFLDCIPVDLDAKVLQVFDATSFKVLKVAGIMDDALPVDFEVSNSNLGCVLENGLIDSHFLKTFLKTETASSTFSIETSK